MPNRVGTRPAICLNMIVRNEAHIVHEVLDSVAPHIASWVIVDTGSDDGTQEVIRRHMARLGIPGELHDRPWLNFGHNRSEALALAQGHGDYIWVMDADDIVAGTPDFRGLGAGVYAMRISDSFTSCTYWRRQLFKDGIRWYYRGVVHEYAHCDDPFTEERLEGEYHIESRRLGGRNLDPRKYERDRDLLLAEVQRHPEDERSMFYLGQTYFNLGEYPAAIDCFERRLEMGGWDEEIYYSRIQIAEAMGRLDAPWADVQDAFLRAWEFRPTRAEPLHAIAARYRADQRYHLGYLFAERAAAIPMPDEDILFVGADVYNWRARDEQAVCASWIGRQSESFAVCRQLLARPDLPADDRIRIAGNRDIAVPSMIDAAASHPDGVVHSLTAGPRDTEVTVSLVAGPDRAVTERTLDSFLNCCLDVSRIGRFVVVGAGLSDWDRMALRERYGFLDFGAGPDDEFAARLARIRDEVGGRFWLHLGHSWRFFAPERLVGRLTAVLDAEPDVFQVAINVGDAEKLTGLSAAESEVRRAGATGRYVVTDTVAGGPAMFDTVRLDRTGAIGLTGTSDELGQRAAAAGLRTASLDEVLCVAGD
ncbi:MAG: glycosyltransferase [Actinobacteria bacterium]|nr:glycosyltransferase [Actinomycetota bacterium]